MNLLKYTGGNKGGTTYIEDVFSTYLYTGNGSTQTITNDIDLSTEGGMVWIKIRQPTLAQHFVFDTERGATNYIMTSLTNAEQTLATTLTAFNTDGFDLSSNLNINGSGEDLVSWTFRKAPRFFDVVTYTGNGVAGREIPHDLGVAPGCMVVKQTSSPAASWKVYHKDLTSALYYLELNSTNAESGDGTVWNSTAPTDSVFTLGSGGEVNILNETYVAYLFADDPLGPSGDGSDGLIKCGTYTGDGVVGNEQSLGWEPQWLLIKSSDTAGTNWLILDVMRGIVVGEFDSSLKADTSTAEATIVDYVYPTPDGFGFGSGDTLVNANTVNYIYIAIRRPMKTPESSSEVFAIDQYDATTPSYISNFVTDMGFMKLQSGASGYLRSRLTQGNYLTLDSTAAEAADASATFDFMDGYGTAAWTSWYSYMWKRAPGFMDVVCYTGTGTAHAEDHGLGVVPEMILVKNRDATDAWQVYFGDETDYLVLNTTAATVDDATRWNDTAPTITQFTVGTAVEVNTSAENYIAILFATLAGISKVFSYTGNGTNQTIDCGFSAGAKLIIIKRTDSTGDWFMWDSVRGIVAGNDPHLSLNTTAAEVTTDDSIDPDNSGFIVNQDAATNINVNTATYAGYAVAI